MINHSNLTNLISKKTINFKLIAIASNVLVSRMIIMKKLNITIGIMICLNSYSQNEPLASKNYQEEKYDTLTCWHFRQAHNIVQNEGINKYAHIIDYPILRYIHDTKECNNLEEHNINVGELKYFIFTIITTSNDIDN